MTTPINLPNKCAGAPVLISRVLAAPCDRVYRAWTEPTQLAQWFSPEEVECRSLTADVKPGGTYRIQMVSAKCNSVIVGQYLEVIPGRRLRFTWQPESYPMPDSVVTVDFEDLGGSTRLTLTHTGFPDQEDSDDHNEGWTSLVAKCDRLLAQNKI